MKPPARNRLPVIAQKSQALSASQRNSDRIKDHGCSDFSETSQLPNHDMSEPQKLQASLPSPLLWSFMHIPRNKHPDEKTPKHGWEKFKGNSQRLSSYFFPIPYPISAVLANVGYVKKKTWLWNISPAKWHIKPLNMLNLIVFFQKTWYSIPSNGLWPFPILDKARISYQVLFSFIPLHPKYRTIITGYKPSSCCSNTPIYDFNTFWFTNHHSRFIRIIELCLPSVYQTWRAGKCPSYRSFGEFPAWHGWWHQGVSH